MDDRSYHLHIPKRLARILLIVTFTALIVVPLTAFATHSFSDVPGSNIFHGDIEWLADAGVTRGCNPPANTEFCPEDEVTRETMAAFMRRFAQYIDAADGTPALADHASTAGDADTLDGIDSSGFASAADLVALVTRVETLESNDAAQDAQIAALEADVATLEADVASLESDVETLQADVVALESDVATLGADVATLESDVTTLEADVAALENLLTSVSLETVDGQPTVRFTGVNVQIVNGSGSTTSNNRRGNLIVGYNEEDGDTRTGSHNIVVGPNHSYMNWGGFVAGKNNTVAGTSATVAGGTGNTASNGNSVVVGGFDNNSNGTASVIVGGRGNAATGEHSVVLGGEQNDSSGLRSIVAGGFKNSSAGRWSSILGGTSNSTGQDDTVVGGDTVACDVPGAGFCGEGIVDVPD